MRTGGCVRLLRQRAKLADVLLKHLRLLLENRLFLQEHVYLLGRVCAPLGRVSCLEAHLVEPLLRGL